MRRTTLLGGARGSEKNLLRGRESSGLSLLYEDLLECTFEWRFSVHTQSMLHRHLGRLEVAV